MVVYKEPEFGLNAFTCPHCDAIAHMNWYGLNKVILVNFGDKSRAPKIHQHKGVVKDLHLSTCDNCNQYSIWVGEKLVYPLSSLAPLPNEGMPDEIKYDFLEAGRIVNESPRGAGALLRLSLQKLMVDLGEPGKNINDDIGNLVKKGLPVKIQQALDSVRVIGNEAAHPGELDLKDDHDTVLKLFDLLNLIVQIMIVQPQEIEETYLKLPDSKRDGIVNRDRK